MKRIALAIVLAATPAAADPTVRFRAGLDLGAVTSGHDGARLDTAGLVNLVPAVVYQPAPAWQLSIGATIPAAPILDLQVPITLDFALFPHLVLRAALRPAYAGIDLCASDPTACPLDAAAQPDDKGGWAAGVLGEVGAAYRIPIASHQLDLRGGYLGGGWFARGGKTERPLGGYWQGFVVGADMTF